MLESNWTVVQVHTFSTPELVEFRLILNHIYHMHDRHEMIPKMPIRSRDWTVWQINKRYTWKLVPESNCTHAVATKTVLLNETPHPHQSFKSIIYGWAQVAQRVGPSDRVRSNLKLAVRCACSGKKYDITIFLQGRMKIGKGEGNNNVQGSQERDPMIPRWPTYFVPRIRATLSTMDIIRERWRHTLCTAGGSLRR